MKCATLTACWSGLLAASLLFAAMPAAEAAFCRCPPPYPQRPVQVTVSRIEANVNDQVARWTQEVTFKNPNSHVVAGATAYLEIEPGSQVDDLIVIVGDRELRGEILSADEAKKVFSDMLKEGGSPALLEHYGNQLVSAQLPRLPAGEAVKVQVAYSAVLKKQGDLVRLQCLNLKGEPEPLAEASLQVNLSSSTAIRNVYSPTHPIKTKETNDADVRVEWSAKDYAGTNPFVVYYQVADAPVAATLLAYREFDTDGHFMVLLEPHATSEQESVLPKDVVFCVDTSGSMNTDDKMTQAREALLYCLQALRPGDRFNIVDFSTNVRKFRDELVEANEENLAAAKDYAKNLSARGGTAICEALETSLDQLGQTEGRLPMVLFATDGLPTIGERNPDGILKRVGKANTQNTRLFVFGEGLDVNAKLLDFLALNNNGESDYILPEENITKKIGTFFDRVGSPLMTDVQVSFSGVDVDAVHPRLVHDLFRGEQLILHGRYTGSGPATMKITGRNGQGEHTLEFPLEFPEVSDEATHDFVPRLWAGKRIEELLNELRVADEPSEELVEEVTYLAKRYGIITPYTSFLMGEDLVDGVVPPQLPGGEVPLPRPIVRPLPGAVLRPGQAEGFGGVMPRAAADQLKEKLEGEQVPNAAAAPAADRERKVREAAELAKSRQGIAGQGNAAALDEQAARAYNMAADARRGLGRQAQRAGQHQRANARDLPLRYVGNQAFYRVGELWVRNDFPSDKQVEIEQVTIGSEEYLQLVADHPDVAKQLALGQVLLNVKSRWGQVMPAESGK